MTEARRIKGIYKDGRIELEEDAPELEGLSLEVSIELPHGGGKPADIRVEAMYPGPLVEFGSGISHLCGCEQIVNIIRKFRAKLQESTGFPLPPVRMVVSDKIEADTYRIRLNTQVMGEGEINPKRILAFVSNPADKKILEQIPGQTVPDPIFSMPSRWILPSMAQIARERGLTVVIPEALVTSHIEEVITQNIPDCLDSATTGALIDAARKLCPGSVAQVIPEILTNGEMQELLRILLGEKRHIGALKEIFEAIAGLGRKTPQELAEEIKPRLGKFIPV
ncbi:MAG: FHIPEP family type III secretion protein [Planctomycetes bacterium]|nr:FHIPEP family type III secretion protein [Planctomycetota bacterium]